MKISIIIPTLNEEKMVGATLGKIGAGVEIIVVDGGSSDRTVIMAREWGAKVVISAEKGRAKQMNLGATIARGDILLFLHGDTLLPEDYRERILESFQLPEVIAGAFELAIEGEEKSLRFVERMVKWRSIWFSLPYGDQGIFLKASTFCDMGGFPDLLIMEDFEFVQRLKRRGKIRIIPRVVVTSGRRWRKLGVWQTTLLNQIIILGYYLGISPQILARLYRGILTIDKR
jgi:rSAM/selenodomain-associated transferase 2